jgi:hypothetical protein
MPREHPRTEKERIAYEKATGKKYDPEADYDVSADGLNRREFIGAAGWATAGAALKWIFGGTMTAGSLIFAVDGARNWHDAEEEATKLHPDARQAVAGLEGIIYHASSAKYDCTYRPPYSYVVCRKVGKGTSCHTVYVPAKYPHPQSARSHIEKALKFYEGAQKSIYDLAAEEKIKDALQKIRGELPNVDTVINPQSLPQRDALQGIEDYCRNLDGRYQDVLYKEVKPQKDRGILEIIASPLVMLAGIIGWSKAGEDEYFEERAARRRNRGYDEDY